MEKAIRVGKVMILEAVLTVVFLCVFALILQKLRPAESVVTMGIKLLYVLVNFIGGMMIGKIMSQRKFLWGVVTGLGYFVIISLLSFVMHQGFYVDIHNALTICLLCMVGGTVGGMLA